MPVHSARLYDTLPPRRRVWKVDSIEPAIGLETNKRKSTNNVVSFVISASGTNDRVFWDDRTAPTGPMDSSSSKRTDRAEIVAVFYGTTGRVIDTNFAQIPRVISGRDVFTALEHARKRVDPRRISFAKVYAVNHADLSPSKAESLLFARSTSGTSMYIYKYTHTHTSARANCLKQ